MAHATTAKLANALVETGGPTALAMSSVADGEMLYRNGATVDGVSRVVTAGNGLTGTWPAVSVNGIVETGGPTTLTAASIADGEFLYRTGTTIDGVTRTPTAGGGLTGVWPATYVSGYVEEDYWRRLAASRLSLSPESLYFRGENFMGATTPDLTVMDVAPAATTWAAGLKNFSTSATANKGTYVYAPATLSASASIKWWAGARLKFTTDAGDGLVFGFGPMIAGTGKRAAFVGVYGNTYTGGDKTKWSIVEGGAYVTATPDTIVNSSTAFAKNTWYSVEIWCAGTANALCSINGGATATIAIESGATSQFLFEIGNIADSTDYTASMAAFYYANAKE